MARQVTGEEHLKQMFTFLLYSPFSFEPEFHVPPLTEIFCLLFENNFKKKTENITQDEPYILFGAGFQWN